MKKQKRGGYATWKCRRCEVVFTDIRKMTLFELLGRDCTKELALYDGKDWHYRMQGNVHLCKDQGIGLADFIGLSPKLLPEGKENNGN